MDFDIEEIIDTNEVSESDSETVIYEWLDVDTDEYEFGEGYDSEIDGSSFEDDEYDDYFESETSTDENEVSDSESETGEDDWSDIDTEEDEDSDWLRKIRRSVERVFQSDTKKSQNPKSRKSPIKRKNVKFCGKTYGKCK